MLKHIPKICCSQFLYIPFLSTFLPIGWHLRLRPTMNVVGVRSGFEGHLHIVNNYPSNPSWAAIGTPFVMMNQLTRDFTGTIENFMHFLKLSFILCPWWLCHVMLMFFTNGFLWTHQGDGDFHRKAIIAGMHFLRCSSIFFSRSSWSLLCSSFSISLTRYLSDPFKVWRSEIRCSWVRAWVGNLDANSILILKGRENGWSSHASLVALQTFLNGWSIPEGSSQLENEGWTNKAKNVLPVKSRMNERA